MNQLYRTGNPPTYLYCTQPDSSHVGRNRTGGYGYWFIINISRSLKPTTYLDQINNRLIVRNARNINAQYITHSSERIHSFLSLSNLNPIPRLNTYGTMSKVHVSPGRSGTGGGSHQYPVKDSRRLEVKCTSVWAGESPRY